MDNKRKYEKYVTEVDQTKFLHMDGVPCYGELNHYDYRDNDEAPHFIEILGEGNIPREEEETVGDAEAGGTAGKLIEFIDPRIYYSTCYRHAPMRVLPEIRLCHLTVCWISLDPEHPDDIGKTMHMWMGQGEEAELHIVDKPTVLLIPPASVTERVSTVKTHGKPGMMLVLIDNPLESMVPSPEMLPPGFETTEAKTEKWQPPTDQNIQPTPNGQGKRGKYLNEVNVKGLPVYPNHQGKLARVLYYDGCNNMESPHCIDCYLIHEAGIGFGLGDADKLPLLPNGETDQTTSYEPLLPHKHPYNQTYTFSPSDKANYPDLGATVEFWIGEGEDAERYIITKASTVLIPKNTVHLPLYVREVRNPFTILTILDTPLWMGCYTQKFPTGFKL